MSDENEKDEDFMSMWRKKMITEIKRPSVIGETLDKVDSLQKENEELRQKLEDNVGLIVKSEDVIKKLMNEKNSIMKELDTFKRLTEANQEIEFDINAYESLKEQLVKKDDQILRLDRELREKLNKLELLTTENEALNKQLETLDFNRFDKVEDRSSVQTSINTELIKNLQDELNKKEKKITQLKKKFESQPSKVEPIPSQGGESDLINELKDQLSKKDIQIQNLDNELKNTLVKLENSEKTYQELEQKFNELAVRKPETPISSKELTGTQALETLCQDLQEELNKYKRSVENLKTERNQLKQAIENKGITIDKDSDAIKKENEELKNELSQLQVLYQKLNKSKQTTEEGENTLIQELKAKLEAKDKIIEEIKISQISPETTPIEQIDSSNVPEEPMSDLIEDLQSKLNKYKNIISQKNDTIEELRKQLNG